jgi:hypothetical protein
MVANPVHPQAPSPPDSRNALTDEHAFRSIAIGNPL